jgi:predicted dehydrogenase
VLLSLTSADMPVDSNRWAIYGDEGMLTADGAEMWIDRPGERKVINSEEPRISPDEAFVATVVEGAPNMATGCDGAYDIALIEAAYRSAKQGRIVHVDLPSSRSNQDVT